MINPIIKQQLESCRVADVPILSEDMTVIQINKCYLLALEDYIINPSPDFTLADNWNRGSVPKHKYYKAEIAQVMGKMVRICGCGYDPVTDTDTFDIWEGWVPQKGIKLIRELK